MEQNKQKKTNIDWSETLVIFLAFAVFLDADECSVSTALCDVNADCENTQSSYRCLCKP